MCLKPCPNCWLLCFPYVYFPEITGRVGPVLGVLSLGKVLLRLWGLVNMDFNNKHRTVTGMSPTKSRDIHWYMIKCISCIIGYPLIFDIIIRIYIYSQYTCCDLRAHTAYSTLQYVWPIQILVQVGIITLARPLFASAHHLKPRKGIGALQKVTFI